MAGGMDLGTSSKNGKKSLDAALNMVPFIDLMAVTIAFFIQAGTWTQVAGMAVSTTGASSASTTDEPPPLPVSVVVTETSLRLTVGTTTYDPMPISRNKAGRIELAPLRLALTQLKQERPEQSAITIEAEDAVAYDDLVRVIDQCLGSKFQNASVTAVATR